MKYDDLKHPVDEILPAHQLFLLGLQHILLMYAGAIAIPILIGGALNLPKDQIAVLISADLFVSGIVSIIQSAGIWRFGVRLPVMMGVTFASVPPMLVMANNPELGVQGIFGAVIGAGIVVLTVAPFIGRFLRFFPPVVVGTVITVTGLVLMPVGLNWSAGGQPLLTVVEGGLKKQIPNPNYGSPEFLVVSFLVVFIIIIIAKFGRGFISNVAILIGLLSGFLFALAQGGVDLSNVDDAAWFAVVRPFYFGMPTFDIGAIIAMSIVMIVVMVETAGMLITVGQMVERPVNEKAMTAGLRVDGLGTILGGVFNTFPYVSYTTNIGLIGATGVKSRWVCVTGGVLLIVLGLIPKFSTIAASIPVYVLGGAMVVLFGMVCAVGIKVLSSVSFSDRSNLFIVGVSIVVGMIPVMAPRFFERAPSFLEPITHSGIVLAALSAFLLNLYFAHFLPALTVPKA